VEVPLLAFRTCCSSPTSASGAFRRTCWKSKATYSQIPKVHWRWSLQQLYHVVVTVNIEISQMMFEYRHDIYCNYWRRSAT
jgi:hypothetical protein